MKLKYISLAQTGYEIVDIAAAKEQNIKVSNAPNYSRQSVAEYAFALALAALRHIPEADQQARHSNVPAESLLGNELFGKTLGVLGLGSIGGWVGRIGQGFGMNVIGHSRTAKNLPGITDVPLDELLTKSDVLMVTIEINPSTIGLLSAKRLGQMKTGSTLVSVVSNQVIDEQAAANLLEQGHLKSASFDELSYSSNNVQRHRPDNPLLKLDNVILSPQAGWYTVEAQQRLLELAVENVEQFINGTPKHLIN